ncbi:hypothetical protein BAY61_24920 [Prauserella marina]|uniref:Uncharacterized protein n=1 Tax=Prauserella marina TaxID=530584 RepID=A0A222VUV2_9PSEU|nr:hypothetical protein [Prauserella marina]ASR37709.1 hypothetical protein BAY61_24920 [Prauserella marina]PWV75641.1 hypothetical protein DES30_106258 [Prauserella marina]SDD29871.1 hypothetical protein SAMN05421630_107182 [Prauserella marina]
MRYRPINNDPQDPRLGRFIPDDWRHVERYPLSALAVEQQPTAVPVVIGVNWYTEFDTPVQDGTSKEWFIARGGSGSLTTVRGGHCVCLEPGGDQDRQEWRVFYDQGSEGACVGFGWSRCMTILNKGELYAARWLWDRAKETDEWPQTNPGDDEGTSVRAAAEILVSAGHVDWETGYAGDDYRERADYTPDPGDGLTAFRWAADVDEVHRVLGNARGDELGAVTILNSWGEDYPERVWLPDDVLDRLIQEDGEIAIPTDR